MAIYFISDLHLSDDHTHLLNLFEYFIQQILQDDDQLYILGDLFEYWIGDDQDSYSALRVKQLLKNLAQRHIDWFFLAGNRDFLLGQQFLKETQGILLSEKVVIDIDGQSLLLMHGDTLCTLDLAYQKWRARVHQPWLQQLFLVLPLGFRKYLAKRMRAKSRHQASYADEQKMDVVQNSVLQSFNSLNGKVMIHGHVHRPGLHGYWNQQQQCWLWRYVLADWDQRGSYLCYKDKQFTLAYFELP